MFSRVSSPLFVMEIVYVISSPAYTTFSPFSVVATFLTSKLGLVAPISFAAGSTARLTGVHQSQKSLATTLSSSSTLVIVVSPTSFTFVPVVISVFSLFSALFVSLFPVLFVSLFIALLFSVLFSSLLSVFGSSL